MRTEAKLLNSKAVNFIKNMSYTISSNLLSLIVSTVVVLIIPKLIGIQEYGYWQLFLFYSSYVGFLHFGWNDGIYLRYGGEEYDKLDKNLFFSQFIQLSLSQIVIGALVWLASIFLIADPDKGFILRMVAWSMILTNIRFMFFYILQATNRIKEYAKLTMLDRVVYIVIIGILIISGVRDYKLMVAADLIGRLVSLIFAAISCKEIVFRKISTFYLTIPETIANINAGIKLMFANIASMLIIGIVRFGIERTWDVTTFGKVSLTLSISNMMMIFINAVGIIIFPILRRSSRESLSEIYSIMRDLLMVLLLGSLIIYYPFKTIMAGWLPQYAESLKYMALVFPVFVYEGKMALLINTYLKTLRYEAAMLKINLVSMCMSLILTYISTRVFRNLDFTVLTIVILLTLRSALAELYLGKKLRIKVNKDISMEIIMTVLFILTGWFINSWLSVLGYGIAYLVYLFIKKKDLIHSVQGIKSLIKA